MKSTLGETSRLVQKTIKLNTQNACFGGQGWVTKTQSNFIFLVILFA